jgi:hypothetical protein
LTPKPSKLAGKDSTGDVFMDNPFQKFHILTACLTKELIAMDMLMSADIHFVATGEEFLLHLALDLENFKKKRSGENDW